MKESIGFSALGLTIWKTRFCSRPRRQRSTNISASLKSLSVTAKSLMLRSTARPGAIP
jgi:hypothetical protein